MAKRPVMAAVGAALIVMLSGACSSAPSDPRDSFAAALTSARAAKDEAFRRQTGQPITPDKVDVFLPLKYFPPDPDFEVPASFTPAAARTPVRIPTSTGKMRDMEVVGTLQFTLKGQVLSLQAFVEAGEAPARLFVPFTDLTTGTETYAAGRYLEIDRSATGVYVVDFNRAFHPYCYYNPDYDCPFPPASNRLPLHVRAGEKMGSAVVVSRRP